ncbi:hypothetical protein V2W47_19715, partial [Acinetobacter baumannii]
AHFLDHLRQFLNQHVDGPEPRSSW